MRRRRRRVRIGTATGGCRTAGRRSPHFALPGSMPRTTARAAWLDWRFNPQAASTNPAFLIASAGGARLFEAVAGEGDHAGRGGPPGAARRLARARADGLVLAGQRPGLVQLGLVPARAPRRHARARGVRRAVGHGRRRPGGGRPHARASSRWRSSRRTATPACAAWPSASAAWPSARSSPPSRCTRRPAAAVPADAARRRRRRHPARAGRRPAAAARGHRRRRQRAHAWTPGPCSWATSREVDTPPGPGTAGRRRRGRRGSGARRAAPAAPRRSPARPRRRASRRTRSRAAATCRTAAARASEPGCEAWLEPGRARSGAPLRRRSVDGPVRRARPDPRAADRRARARHRPGRARGRPPRAGPALARRHRRADPRPTDASRRSPGSARRRSCGSSTTPTATRPAGARARRSGSGWSAEPPVAAGWSEFPRHSGVIAPLGRVGTVSTR